MTQQPRPKLKINNPLLRLVPGVTRRGRQVFELCEPLRVRSRHGLVMIITVPAGYRTDFASVPRLFWRLYPPIGNYAIAAVVHDYLYSQGVVSRFLADAIFREIMRDRGVPWSTRVPMYYAVRLFGRQSGPQAQKER